MKKYMSPIVLLGGLFLGFSNSVYAKKALVIVDMQSCFVAGNDPVAHSLPVAGGRDIVAGINKLQDKFDLIVATKDWHPANHGSFASQHPGKKVFEKAVLGGIDQVLWPDHCVENTAGAEFVEGLKTDKIAHITYKGLNVDVDSYSGFKDNRSDSITDLDDYLKSQKVTELYVVGLAADYCVRATAIDGADLKYKTFLVKDLTKAVDPSEQNMAKVYDDLTQAGVTLITSSDI